MRALVLCFAFAALTASFPGSTTATNDPPVVAVIDSGITLPHEAFPDGTVIAWKDFTSSCGGTPCDGTGHGTGVASRVLAAFPDARLAVARVLDDHGRVHDLKVLEAALLWAVDEAGADVVTVSIGHPGFPSPFRDAYVNEAVTHARDRGVLVTWSAGNWLPGQNPVTVLQPYGAGSRHALVAGAADAEGARASWSRVAPDVIAPGERVRVASAGGGWTTGSGTSFAAPFVAGVAAGVLAEHSALDADALEELILAAAEDRALVPYAEEGHGLVSEATLERALAIARGDAPQDEKPLADAQRAGVDAARTVYGEHPLTLARDAT